MAALPQGGGPDDNPAIEALAAAIPVPADFDFNGFLAFVQAQQNPDLYAGAGHQFIAMQAPGDGPAPVPFAQAAQAAQAVPDAGPNPAGGA